MNNSKTRPAFAKTFRPDENNFAVLSVGWPARRPPASNVLAVPPGTSPAALDLRLLKGTHVFVTPPAGAHAQRDVLRELGAELAGVAVESLTVFDGDVVLADWWRAGRPRVLA